MFIIMIEKSLKDRKVRKKGRKVFEEQESKKKRKTEIGSVFCLRQVVNVIVDL